MHESKETEEEEEEKQKHNDHNAYINREEDHKNISMISAAL